MEFGAVAPRPQTGFLAMPSQPCWIVPAIASVKQAQQRALNADREFASGRRSATARIAPAPSCGVTLSVNNGPRTTVRTIKSMLVALRSSRQRSAIPVSHTPPDVLDGMIDQTSHE